MRTLVKFIVAAGLLIGVTIGLVGCSDGSQRINAAANEVHVAAVAFCDSSNPSQAKDNKNSGTREASNLLNSLRKYATAYLEATNNGRLESYPPDMMYDQVSVLCPQAAKLIDDFYVLRRKNTQATTKEE